MQINRCYLIHGFLPAFFSACCFAVMAVCIKIASSELPAPQLVFLRSVVGLLIILPIVLPRGVNFIKTPIFRSSILWCWAIPGVVELSSGFYGSILCIRLV